MELTQEVQESIKKNLPSQVGDLLKEVLEQGKKDKEKVGVLEKDYEKFQIEIKRLQEEIRKYMKLDERNSKLDIKEKEILEKERMLEVTILREQLLEANKRSELAVGFTQSLVRNTIFRENIFDSKNQMGYNGANGQWVQPSPINQNLTKDKTAE